MSPSYIRHQVHGVGLSAKISFAPHRCFWGNPWASQGRLRLPKNNRAELHYITATIPHARHHRSCISFFLTVKSKPAKFLQNFLLPSRSPSRKAFASAIRHQALSPFSFHLSPKILSQRHNAATLSLSINN